MICGEEMEGGGVRREVLGEGGDRAEMVCFSFISFPLLQGYVLHCFLPEKGFPLS